MSLPKIISTYTRYNHWANEKMIQWLKTSEQDILYQKIPSSYDSIDLTMQHMAHAQSFWYAVINGDDFTSLDESFTLDQVDSSMIRLLSGSQQFFTLCRSYSEADLLKFVATDVTEQSRYDFILQYVNHNTYHRGQIITMARGLGITENLPLTDYEYFLWSAEQAEISASVTIR